MKGASDLNISLLSPGPLRGRADRRIAKPFLLDVKRGGIPRPFKSLAPAMAVEGTLLTLIIELSGIKVLS